MASSTSLNQIIQGVFDNTLACTQGRRGRGLMSRESGLWLVIGSASGARAGLLGRVCVCSMPPAERGGPLGWLLLRAQCVGLSPYGKHAARRTLHLEQRNARGANYWRDIEQDNISYKGPKEGGCCVKSYSCMRSYVS